MMAMKHGVLVLVGAVLASCTPYQQQAGLIGAVGGAAAGAVFGDDHQDVVAGAAAGAAIGAGAAAVHESNQQRRNYSRYGIPEPDSRSSQPQNPPPGSPPAANNPPADYPVAQRTENADEVLSPYPPHHRINVAGFKPGQLARDPKNNKIFRVP